MDVHQRRRYKRLKGAELGLKTERSTSRNPPLTRSTRALLHRERVIGSFELLKEALALALFARIHPRSMFFPQFSTPFIFTCSSPRNGSLTLQQLARARTRANTFARLPLNRSRRNIGEGGGSGD